MFLVPSHIRKTLQSVISDQSLQGPHTALVLLAHGQVLCAASNADTDWPSTSDDNDGEDQVDDQEEENDDDEEEDEPYIPTPERNRMLRGIVKSQLIGIDGFYDQHEDSTDGTKPKLKGMKIECDLGRIYLHPIPLTFPTPSTLSNRPPHLPPLISNFNPQSLTYTCTALGTSPSDSGLARVQGNGTKGGNGRREGVLVLVLNGVDGLAWGELERAAKSFETSFRTKRS